MDEPENLSDIVAAAAASDIALVVDSKTVVLSVVVSLIADSFGNLNHREGRPLIEFLANDSIEKFQKAHAQFLSEQSHAMKKGAVCH